MIKEIPVEDFTAAKWTRLAQTADAKCKWPRRFNPEHFFPEVRKLMGLNMAKAWSNEDGNAFLVSMFHTNIFSGSAIGLALFWVSMSGQASIGLMREFQEEAVRRGCEATYASAFRNYRSAGMTRLFRRLGYEPHETGFIRMVNKEN